MLAEARVPEENEAPIIDPAAMMQFDEEATRMIQQAVVDYISTLPPAARAATDAYFRQVLPRTRVLLA